MAHQETVSRPASRGAGATPAVRRVALCADDFGISDAVSEVILALLRQGRLSATSVMMNGRAGRASSDALREIPGIGIGLHLTLTAGAPLGAMPRLAPGGRFPPLPAIIRGAVTRLLPRHEIRDEIRRQVGAFAERFGRLPDHLDGHQHVHALPTIRDALFEALGDRPPSSRFWLRDPADRVGAIRSRPAAGKALVVAALSAGFAKRARWRGISCNRGFSGFTTFAECEALPDTFEALFGAMGPEPVVMCHPGGIDEDLRALDPVTESRPREAHYLASDRFAAFLARRGIVLVPSPGSEQKRHPRGDPGNAAS